jgi:hypothetical protein
MKSLGFPLAVLISTIGSLSAQVTVEVTQDQDQFLPGEALTAIVRVTNRSGQTLHLGEEGWLTFTIESGDGTVISKKGDAPVEEAFTLDSSKRATARVDLEPYFSLRQPGRYKILATVHIREWSKSVTSAAKPFDIIQGSKIWDLEVGLPKAPGATNVLPEIRVYTLHQANYLRKQLMLYAQISDSHGKICKVLPIGPMISFGQPQPRVDKLSNLHVLYQDGPRSFNYTAIDPDGNIFLRQSYEFTTRPSLKADLDGNVTVAGGARRIKSSDVPPPKISTAQSSSSETNRRLEELPK